MYGFSHMRAKSGIFRIFIHQFQCCSPALKDGSVQRKPSEGDSKKWIIFSFLYLSAIHGAFSIQTRPLVRRGGGDINMDGNHHCRPTIYLIYHLSRFRSQRTGRQSVRKYFYKFINLFFRYHIRRQKPYNI